MERKCSCCGSANMVPGHIQTTDGLKLFFISNKESKKFWPKGNKISAYVCSECGNVALFTDKTAK